MKNEYLNCIIEILIERMDYITVYCLANKLNVSKKTVYNYLDSPEIKNLLKGCFIEKKQNRGVKLIGSDQSILEVKRNLELSKATEKAFSTNIYHILRVLFTNKNPYTMKTFSEELHKSQTSISSEINKISIYLEKMDINLIKKENSGISVCGDESSIREAFKELCLNNNIFLEKDAKKMRYIHDTRMTDVLYSRIQNIFIELNIDSIIKCINLSESVLNNKFTEHDFYTLLIKLCILISRIKIGKNIINNNTYLKNTNEFLAAEIILIKIEKGFKIKVSTDELYEITTYILSCRNQINNKNNDLKLKNTLFVEKFITSISNCLGIKFIDDKELFKNLSLHLEPAIRRMKFGLKSDNPLLNRIKYEYTGIYSAVLTSIDELEKECGISFDTNEIGYICLHIVISANRIHQGRYLKTCLICDGGITISKYLESVIQKEIKEIEITKIITSSCIDEETLMDFDLILNSTNAITDDKDNSIKINDFIEINEINIIKNWISNLFNKSKGIDFLKQNVFIFKEDIQTRDEVLNKYGRYLENINYVKSGYTKSLLEREEKTPTSVGRSIAVPHGCKELVITQSLIIIKLKNPIIWGDQEVKLVMLLSVNFDDNQHTKYFFKRLYEIISDEYLLNRLKEVENLNALETLFETGGLVK
ncbi:PRD domain-containing protein [Clostridium estertheticum]|uniref:BglG family transcription antiterminator n=1 Tax=Clostridium estertheticum TaxID=238834 RepID=UPI001C0E8077|nr:PRD domain-containing protein [Clostridium estertheticum]MBU3217477.1 PRD domain-containing protein [Clostridium estertheticum]WAG56657.1 PRD domain-containing protein [Clostridium estertheticum]